MQLKSEMPFPAAGEGFQIPVYNVYMSLTHDYYHSTFSWIPFTSISPLHPYNVSPVTYTHAFRKNTKFTLYERPYTVTEFIAEQRGQ